MSQISDHPEVRAAVAEEARIRGEAFLDLRPELCGIQLAPLTVRRLDLLIQAESPFVVGGRAPGPADVAVFAWAMHPRFRPSSRWQVHRWLLIRRLRGVSYAAALEAIASIVSDAMMDRPPTRGGGESSCRMHWPSFIVDRIASAYGWTENQILDLPLARAWQYLALIRVRTEADGTAFNPLSDRARRLVLLRRRRGTDKAVPA